MGNGLADAEFTCLRTSIEGQEALGRLVRRFPDLALAAGEIEWKPTTTIRGPARLRLEWQQDGR